MCYIKAIGGGILLQYHIPIKKLIGLNYDWLFNTGMKYNLLETAKNAKKSNVIALKLVIDMLIDNRSAALVLRKFSKDHKQSTFLAIRKAFERISKETGYNWEAHWDYSDSSQNMYYLNRFTKQRINFGSFDRYDSITGLETNSTNLYNQTIWWEEPLQKDNDSNKTFMDAQEIISSFYAIENTFFRGILPNNGKRRIYMTYNDWEPDAAFRQEFIIPFVNKNEDKLLKYGAQLYINPHAFEGQGIAIFFATAGVNEFTDDEKRATYRHLKATNYELYKVIVGGLGANFSGNAYGSENLGKVKKLDDHKQIKSGIFLFGIDYSSVKDKTVVTFVILTKDGWHVQIVDFWCYVPKTAKVKLTDTEQIDNIISWIYEKCSKFKNYNDSGMRAIISVDSRDAVVISALNERLSINPHMKHYINSVIPAQKHGIAGNAARIQAVRYLMSMSRISIYDHAFHFYLNEWKNRNLNKKGIPIDGNDDASQSFEYSITNFFNKIFTNEEIANFINYRNAIKETLNEQF